MAAAPSPLPHVDRCIPGREVVLRFRSKRSGKVWSASIICPVRWSRERVLTYARRCHPNDTVRIQEWKPRDQPDNPWETRFWIVNPKEMLLP